MSTARRAVRRAPQAGRLQGGLGQLSVFTTRTAVAPRRPAYPSPMSTFEKEITPATLVTEPDKTDSRVPRESDSTGVGVKRKLDRRFVLAALMLVMVLASIEQT